MGLGFGFWVWYRLKTGTQKGAIILTTYQSMFPCSVCLKAVLRVYGASVAEGFEFRVLGYVYIYIHTPVYTPGSNCLRLLCGFRLIRIKSARVDCRIF